MSAGFFGVWLKAGETGAGFGARLCAEHQPQRVGWLKVTGIYRPLRLVCDTAAIRSHPILITLEPNYRPCGP